MSLFQKSVLNKYYNELPIPKIRESFLDFQSIFNNPVKQQNILNAKEEQYQEGFLRELFAQILGYTLYPDGNHNLITEQKNEKNSKKADGAILNGLNVIAVIELKSTKTVDLASIESQAFGYKNNQQECKYVITSNFKKLRFYIDNAVEFLEFDLFNLPFEDFKLMWVCLSANYLLKNIPAQIKEASNHQEEKVTKQLYADYAKFRTELFNDICGKNTDYGRLFLFKKTQKLLDRFLFLFFAEDRGLVAPNWTRKILQDWTDLKDRYDNYIPLYIRFRKNFDYLNTGYSGKDGEIFAYNGGLFAPDEILDSLIVDDDLLYKGALKLSNYDFDSEVDVNILGHIFEHSLNEIDEIQASLQESKVEKVTKRKKDGVFYTPKYITKYIVENTIGTLCKVQKEKLEIIAEDFEFIDAKAKGKERTKRETLNQKINDYRDWLLALKIVDPACGSGAFLNQALEFLITEHAKIDELKARLLGGSIVLSDVETSILENNLYGVDINDEAVEIAKLSLWLRTARKGRKLNSLNNNLKCGNSLIDDVAVAGDKAFNWNTAFKEVFDKGGFDVVIGNPPYLRVQGLRSNFKGETIFYEKEYKSATGRFDIYVLFIEQAFRLINSNGKVSFIVPHKFMVSDFGYGIRDFLIINNAIESVVSFGSEMVFEDASTYTCVLGLSTNNQIIKYVQISPTQLFFKFEFENVEYRTIDKQKWNLQGEDSFKLFEKLNKQPQTIKSIFENISQGVVSVGDDIFLIKGKIKGDKFIGFSDKVMDFVTLEADVVKPLLKGEDVKKYAPLSNNYYCLYPHYELKGKTFPFEEEFFKNTYPLAYNYMLPFKEELIEKKIRYKTNPTAWYSLHRSREISLFEQEKIITPETSFGGNMTIDVDNYYHNTQVYTLNKKEEVKEDYRFWLAILNSSLFWFFLQNTGAVLRGGYFRFKTKYLEPFPLPELKNLSDQVPFVEKVNQRIKNTSEIIFLQKQFLKLLHSRFDIGKMSGKLLKWNELLSKEFFKELAKQKVKLSLSEQSDWLQYFEEQKQKASIIKSQIEQTDKEIDKMVFALYELTEEEIKIVEG